MDLQPQRMVVKDRTLVKRIIRATGEGREAVVAAILWLKTRAGWKEAVVNEHTIGRPADMLSDDEVTTIAFG